MSKESSKKFWNREYAVPRHLLLSDEPAEDMGTFARWAVRNAEWFPFPKGGSVIDIGCGNGRNLIALAKEFNMKGYGMDISDIAIQQAKILGKGLEIEWKVADMSEALPVPDQSADVVLDMMSSHVLKKAERDNLLKEVVRVTKPYGWFFLKTFIMDGDMHAKRLIKDHPGGEENSYIHPKMGHYEYVWTEEKIRETFAPYFKIFKMNKSYKHVTRDGKPHKRRTISVYMERKGE
jgi:ubiquinone/menaquinone biosynthesis C-methylase UbiE